MRQSIQEWTKLNFLNTAFKKFEGYGSASSILHIPSNFLKAVFQKFYLSILEYFVPYIELSSTSPSKFISMKILSLARFAKTTAKTNLKNTLLKRPSWDPHLTKNALLL